MQQILSLLSIEGYEDFHILILFAFILLGLYLLIQGSHYILNGASTIARILSISEFIIGITIVALSTSLPEIFVSTNAAAKGVGEIAIANVVGSNLFNLILIFMILSLFSKNIFAISRFTLCTIIVLHLGILFMSIVKVNILHTKLGVFLLVLCIVYFYLEILKNKSKSSIEILTHKESQQTSHTIKVANPIKQFIISMVFLIIGVGFLYVGSEFFLDSARTIGYRLNIPDAIIGMIFIALGTSLPELMITVVSIIKGYVMKSTDTGENFQSMAEGNIVGSNILNILGVLGISATFYPLQGIANLKNEIIWMNIAGLLLIILMVKFKNNKVQLSLQKGLGIALFILLVGYMVYCKSILVS